MKLKKAMPGSYRANNLIVQYLAKQNLAFRRSSNRINELEWKFSENCGND
jgi:hypothetical protein